MSSDSSFNAVRCYAARRNTALCYDKLHYATRCNVTLRYAASIGVKEQQESKISNEADNGGDSEGLTSIWGS